MYAVIETGGKQYKVEAGDVLQVEKLDNEVGSTITFDAIFVNKDGKILTDAKAKAVKVTA